MKGRSGWRPGRAPVGALLLSLLAMTHSYHGAWSSWGTGYGKNKLLFPDCGARSSLGATDEKRATGLDPPGQRSVSRKSRRNRWERDEVKKFIDVCIEDLQSQFRLPGVGVALVHDGEVVYMAGYGWAEVQRRVPVSVTETVWRIASLSKVITATAAMQLVEKGRLDLDRDYRGVLPELGWWSNGPVTLRALLTHTSGLEEDSFGMVRPGIVALEPLSDYLRRARIRQRRRLGERIAYSNHGIVLVGRLIEWASGRSYEAYVRESLLEPLGMRRSGFAWNEETLAHLATGYTVSGDGWREVPTDTILATPSGGLQSTVADMAQFLRLHTGNGSVAGRKILDWSSLAAMHRPAFRLKQEAAGMALGFWERRQNGLDGVEHGGAIRGYSSWLAVWPSERLGLFLVTNCQQVAFSEAFITRFLDHFYPVKTGDTNQAGKTDRLDLSEPSTAGEGGTDGNSQDAEKGTGANSDNDAVAQVPLERFAGVYYLERYRPESVEKLHGLLAELRVRKVSETELEIRMPLEVLPAWRVRRESATVFREVNTQRPVVFLLDEWGSPMHICLSAALCGERASWYEVSTTHLLIGGGLAIWWLAGLIRFCGAKMRGPFGAGGHTGKDSKEKGAATKWTIGDGNGWYAAYCGLGLVWLIGLVGVMIGVDSWRFTYGIPWWLRILLGLPLVAMVVRLKSEWRYQATRPAVGWQWWQIADLMFAVVWLAELVYWHLWPWA